jgi:hypothetical protein
MSISDDRRTRRIACARGGTAFECGALSGTCWCAEEAFRLPVPADGIEDCVCPACLRAAAAAQPSR